MIGRLTTACLAATAWALAGQALAAPAVDTDSMLEKAFGSTIVSTYPDGRQGELWLQRDGGYTATGRRVEPSSGRWQIKGDRLCLKQQKPFGVPFSYCTPVPAAGLDKPWSAKAPTGDPITIKVVKGLHGRDPQPSKAAADDKTGKG